MKEKDFLKSVSDRQMPDLEKIRENIINGTAEEKKPKIIAMKPSRLIAVAAVVAFALIGTIAAVASAGGVFPFFSPQPQVTATADEAAPVVPPKQIKKKTVKKKVKKHSKKTDNKTIKKLSRDGYDLTFAEKLGNVGDFELIYGGTRNTEKYECSYIIDNYTFNCKEQFASYGLGLYISGGEKTYSLTQARDENIIPDINKVIELIDEKSDDVDYKFTYKRNNSFADWIKSKLNKRTATLTKLGKTGGFDVYYNLKSNAYKNHAEEDFGDIKISTDRPKKDYPLGIYLTDGDQFGNLGFAFDNGWIEDFSKLEDLIMSNPKAKDRFSFDKYEEDETEEVTETETQAETKPEDEEEIEIETQTDVEDDTEPVTENE